MALRIIAGEYGGRIIQTLDGERTRPTSERVREALFSRLQFAIPGARVLDLFAGSGALGLEAKSRGASHVVFVESATDAFFVLSEAIRALGCAREVTMINTTAQDALQALAHDGRTFDFIFMDPPYERVKDWFAPLMQAIVKRKLLAPDGQVVLEAARGTKVQVPPGFALTKEKRYGHTQLLFWEEEVS